MFSIVPFALAIFLVASMFRLAFMYHALYLLAGVYLAAHFWSRRGAESLEFRRQHPERAFLGEIVRVQLDVRNRSLLPMPWVRIQERLPLSLAAPAQFARVVSLAPHESTTFSYELSCRQRGYYPIGPLSAWTGDLFGLFERSAACPISRHLTVYPQIVALEELGLPSKSPFGHLRTREPLYEDPARVIGVRDYASGDSLRKINWKTSAAAGRLQVKKYEPAMTLQTVVLLNLSLADYQRQHAYHGTEMGIVVAASVVHHLGQLRQEVGLLTNGGDPASADNTPVTGVLPRKGRAQIVRLLELLGRVQQPDHAPFAELLGREAIRFPWGATLIVVTAQETEELLRALIALQRSGFPVTVVYDDYPSQFSFERAERRAAGLGIRCYRVWKEEDLNVWRRR
ncbi:MAG: DUF58 domain-containing protein [Chloroflexi bacterium]|nr:DUF58 domain-containing protein [Chloroflexota bacterium]